MIWKILYALSVLTVLMLSLRNRKYLLYGFVFSLPWFGLMVDVGITLNIDRFISFFMLIAILPILFSFRQLNSVYTFLAYAFASTIVLSLYFLPDTEEIFSPFRGEYRWVLQIVMWSLLFTPVFFFQTVKKPKEIQRILKILVLSVFILCVLGWVQMVVYYVYNFDMLPIGLLDQGTNRTGMLTFKGVSILRISSLGGEPKHLAYSIVTAISVLFVNILYQRDRAVSKSQLMVLLFFVASLFLTFSSQGFILFFLDIILILFLSVIILNDIYIRRLVPLLLVMFVGLSFLVYFEYDIVTLLEQRTIGRLIESGYIEDWNAAVLNFMVDNPKHFLLGVGLGNIHLYAQHYIPEYAIRYMYGNVFVAKSGSLRLLSEVGIIGFFLFTYAYLKPTLALHSVHRRFKHNLGANNLGQYLVLSIVVFTNFLITANGPPYIFLMMAISYSVYKLMKIEEQRLLNAKAVHNN